MSYLPDFGIASTLCYYMGYQEEDPKDNESPSTTSSTSIEEKSIENESGDDTIDMYKRTKEYDEKTKITTIKWTKNDKLHMDDDKPALVKMIDSKTIEETYAIDGKIYKTVNYFKEE